jgi:hypothetical protein
MTALVQTVLKNTRTETVVKITGTGTAAITLASLALSDDVYTAAKASVEIRKIWISAPPTQLTTITRNSVAVLQAYGQADTNFEDVKLNDQASKDLSVVTAGDGTVILWLRKSGGYDWPYRSTALTGGA